MRVSGSPSAFGAVRTPYHPCSGYRISLSWNSIICKVVLLPWFAAVLFFFFSLPVAHAQEVGQDEDVPSGWKILGSPYISADSDHGLIIGLGVGASNGPGRSLAASASYASRGDYGAGITGEYRLGKYRLLRSVNAYRNRRFLYSPGNGKPEKLAEYLQDKLDLQLAALFPVTQGMELGPDLHLRVVKGLRPEDSQGNSLQVLSNPVFGQGSIATIGLRARWKNMSSIRPEGGYLVEAGVRSGRVSGTGIAGAKPEMEADLMVAGTHRINEFNRLYLRIRGAVQGAAPPPVRNYSGGETTLRGEPDWRDQGRKVLLFRAQVHHLLFRDVLQLSRLANSIIPLLPLWAFDVETVAFYDAGVTGDRDYGWRPMRHSFGGGLRIVLPPVLVFHLDLAFTPYGGKAFYFGAGETL